MLSWLTVCVCRCCPQDSMQRYKGASHFRGQHRPITVTQYAHQSLDMAMGSNGFTPLHKGPQLRPGQLVVRSTVMHRMAGNLLTSSTKRVYLGAGQLDLSDGSLAPCGRVFAIEVPLLRITELPEQLTNNPEDGGYPSFDSDWRHGTSAAHTAMTGAGCSDRPSEWAARRWQGTAGDQAAYQLGYGPDVFHGLLPVAQRLQGPHTGFPESAA